MSILERIDHGLPYYRFADWTGIRHGIFTRLGGVSRAPWASLNLGGTVGDETDAVRRNHELIYETLGVAYAQTVTVWQVHGVDTIIADRPVKGRRWLALADGMITDNPNVVLVMRYADCTPILAYDPVKGAIGIAHAGWRGTVNGMATHLITAMKQAYGCRPSDLRAGIGPSIGPRKYQVGEEVIGAVMKRYQTIDSLIMRDPQDGTAYFNLWEANTRDLMRAGLAPEQIAVMGICTAENTAEFFSHRAERGQTGRFGAVIALT
ncbi:MAG: peptidoglycan editing factor PgeF [Anaerolineae bacterium]|nr:peptidoglycan editing factor PgeF [Anaerolineae bacterium]